MEKEEKEEKTTRSSDPSSSPISRQSYYTPQFMQTSSSHLVSPIFFLVVFSSLALSPALLAEKPFFSSSYKSSYFLSFGTDLLARFLYIPFVYGLPNWEVWCVPMLILFVDVDFVIVDGVFVVVVSIVIIITSWLLAKVRAWIGMGGGMVGEVRYSGDRKGRGRGGTTKQQQTSTNINNKTTTTINNTSSTKLVV